MAEPEIGADAKDERWRMSEMRTAVIGTLLVTLGPLSLSLYTPALPELTVAFGTTTAALKLTMTSYFAGYAVTQLVVGPLSDAFGRRIITILFLAAYLLGSLIAASTGSIEGLMAGRAIQGVGAAAGVAVSRAIVRDLFDGQAAARIFSLIGQLLAVVPAAAPALGGLIMMTIGWHAIFMVMLGYGVMVLVFFILLSRETNRSPNPAAVRPLNLLRNYLILLSDRRFMADSMVMAMSLGGLYALTAFLPFAMIDKVGMTPLEYGYFMLIQTGAYTLGAVVTGRLLTRIDAVRLVPAGLLICAISGVVFIVALRGFDPSVLTVMGPCAIWAFGIALVAPGASTSAMSGFGHIAGSASALIGFMQIGGGLAGSAIGALFFPDPIDSLTIVLPSMALIAVLCHYLLRPGSARV